MNNDNIIAMASNYSKFIITVSFYAWILSVNIVLTGILENVLEDDGRTRRLL